jgi:hypothetical protein
MFLFTSSKCKTLTKLLHYLKKWLIFRYTLYTLYLSLFDNKKMSFFPEIMLGYSGLHTLALAHCQFIFTMSNVQEMKTPYLNVRIGVGEYIVVVTTTLLVYHVQQVTSLKITKKLQPLYFILRIIYGNNFNKML